MNLIPGNSKGMIYIENLAKEIQQIKKEIRGEIIQMTIFNKFRFFWVHESYRKVIIAILFDF